MTPIAVRSVEPFVFRSPLEVPRRNAFGVQHSRAAFLVRVTDGEGVAGWGEGFCNWPAFAAEYRASYVREVIAPLLEGSSFTDPPAARAAMNDGLHRLRTQSADHGPVDHAVAATDGAIWDLFARRAGVPLWRALGADAPGRVDVYASALTGPTLERFLPGALARGITRFKLKVGFGREADAQALRALRAAVGRDAALMVDANQAWTLAQARDAIATLQQVTDLDWVEEPIAATEPPRQWCTLRDQTGAVLAAGENLFGPQALAPYLDAGAFDVVQPDLVKWGGPGGTRELLQRIASAGARACPHYLGAGVGLAATAHLVAATGGGLLEFDVSENPYRDALGNPAARIVDGTFTLGDAPGIGFDPDPDTLATRAARGRTNLSS